MAAAGTSISQSLFVEVDVPASQSADEVNGRVPIMAGAAEPNTGRVSSVMNAGISVGVAIAVPIVFFVSGAWRVAYLSLPLSRFPWIHARNPIDPLT